MILNECKHNVFDQAHFKHNVFDQAHFKHILVMYST